MLESDPVKSQQSWRIRRAAVSEYDASIIRDIAHKGWIASYSRFFPRDVIETFLTEVYQTHKLLMTFQSKYDLVLIIETSKGEALGFAHVRLAKHGRFADLIRLYMYPEQTGKGFGKVLIHAVFDELKARNIEMLRVDVHAENEGAIRFYEREGFKFFSRARGMIQNWDVPMVVLQREI